MDVALTKGSYWIACELSGAALVFAVPVTTPATRATGVENALKKFSDASVGVSPGAWVSVFDPGKPIGFREVAQDVAFVVRGRDVAGCDPLDFNRDDVWPDTQDIFDFVYVFGGGACPTQSCGDTDFNNDSVSPDSQDIADFVLAFAGGSC
jgi:hypothetical protein